MNVSRGSAASHHVRGAWPLGEMVRPAVLNTHAASTAGELVAHVRSPVHCQRIGVDWDRFVCGKEKRDKETRSRRTGTVTICYGECKATSPDFALAFSPTPPSCRLLLHHLTISHTTLALVSKSSSPRELPLATSSWCRWTAEGDDRMWYPVT